MNTDEETRARLTASAPNLFSLLIKARNELALLGKMAPLSKLCGEIDSAINDVRGNDAQHTTRSR